MCASGGDRRTACTRAPALVQTLRDFPRLSAAFRVARTMLPLGVMTNLGWRSSGGRLDADGARRAILAQHVRIRDLLDRARQVADGALDGRAHSQDAVASAIGDLRMTMDAHLAFEEHVLLPILNDDLPLVPQRAQNLAAEHRHQREMLAMLHEEARTAPWVATLAAKLMFLTDWLLADMTHEETDLLTSEVVRDDAVVIDQNSG
jgi:hypothetical protein